MKALCHVPSNDPPILELAKWTRRLAETHIALGQHRATFIVQWGEAYLDSGEGSATGAIKHADALTAQIKAVVTRLEGACKAEAAVVQFLRDIRDWDDVPTGEFSPFPSES